ncbi:MAG: alpha/beta hydrolase [Candidatus Sulfotelmatobacter sp.]|jgi:pimeloyl-ACP methyl ester carboxylesterase
MKPGKAVIGATNLGFKANPTLPTRKSSLSACFTYCGLACAILATVLFFCSANRAVAQSSESHGVKNVILVHGAWADGSSWSKVIPLLEAKGLKVTAVQLPLTSLADDVATVKRAFALEDGPFLLVGHSYGGSVITEAGNDPNVAGLVYVAAFAPDKGQSTLDLITANPTPVGPELRPTAGFFKLSAKGVFEDFAPDLPEVDRKVLFATQGPIAGAALGVPTTTPAWRNKPSWFVIAGDDRMISPKLEEAEAQEMKAKSITISSGHLVMLSHPADVAGFIEGAAQGSGTD